MFEGIVTPLPLGAPDPKDLEAMMESKVHERIWEIPSPLKCPVVGLGVSDEEGRRVLKKCGRRVKQLKAWEVHRDLMEEVGCDTPVARRIDALLKRKFGPLLEACEPLDPEALLPRLKEAMARGDAAGALYCVSMRKDLSPQLLADVAGEAHMMGHTTAVELFAARRNERRATEKLGALKGVYEQEKRDRRALVREKLNLEQENRELIQALERQSSEVGDLVAERKVQSLEDEVTALRNELSALQGERETLTSEVRRLEREKRKLQIRGMELTSENKALSDEVMHLAVGRTDTPLKSPQLPMDGCCTCDKAQGCTSACCPAASRCQRRVLMVGGLSRMEPHYRRVAEAKGLGFDYHDGTMSGGRKTLEHLVCRSDMVICPVSCNSHNACQSVKKLCAKHKKELRFLPSSSISALTCAIQPEVPGI